MINQALIQKCLDYFAEHQPSCGNYRRASRLWESSGHSVSAMLEHDDADEWRYISARNVCLTRGKRWELVRDIRDEELRCCAACLVRLSRSRRWELVRDIRDEELRYISAWDVPGLTRAKRWELVRDIQNEDWRYYAADYVPDLTDKQRAELREKR